MFEVIDEKLRTMEEHHMEVDEVLESIFETVKKNEIQALPQLKRRQDKLFANIKYQKNTLAKELDERMGRKNVRLQEVLDELPVEEREKILDAQKRIQVLIKRVQHKLERNKGLLEVMLSSKQAVVDTIVDINRYRGEGEGFLNTSL